METTIGETKSMETAPNVMQKSANKIAEITIAQKPISQSARNLQRSLLCYYPVPTKNFMLQSLLDCF